MRCAKIIVKNNYENRGDLVLRSYIRALRKINADRFLDGDNAIIYGLVDKDGLFHELYTNEVIDYDNYLLVIAEEMYYPCGLPNDKKTLMKKINEKVLFGKDVDLDFEISTIEELAKDRAIEFNAYNSYLSRINPYMRLSEDEQYRYNDYNNFKAKVKEAKKLCKMDYSKDNDEYDVKSYYPRPEEEKDDEYLVFEVPKTFTKRK